MLENEIFCRFETPSEIPANYLAGNFSELYAPVLQRETTHENSTFELASPSVQHFFLKVNFYQNFLLKTKGQIIFFFASR
jgi:hypothetical protein